MLGRSHRRSVGSLVCWRRACAVFWLSLCAGVSPLNEVAAQPLRTVDAEIAAATAEAAARFGLPEAWIQAVVAAESHGDPGAISPKGAMGLMQLMPGTWAELRRDLRLGDDAFDRRDNLIAGAAYLRRLYDLFGEEGVFAAYNAGPARYAAHLLSARPLPAETLGYVAAIRRHLRASGMLRSLPPRAVSADWRRAPLFVGAAPRDEESRP